MRYYRGMVPAPDIPGLYRRFVAKVARGAPDECWPWTATCESQGYGILRLANKRTLKAHRTAFFFEHGPIDPGMCVCHRCDNRPCCNPAHLFLGTVGDNNRDRSSKGRGRENRQRGVDNPNAKITADDARRIRDLVRSGRSQISAGAEFGIKQPHVSRIMRGLVWPE